MGGLSAVRNHLYNLFPSVFKRNIELDTAFALIIVDLMQFLAGKVKFQADGHSTINIDGITSAMQNTVESYIPTHNTEYRATQALVVLLDTTKNVPTNKAGTQLKRDQGGSKILDRALYERYSKRETIVEGEEDEEKDEELELGHLLKWPLDGETIWRSNNTRFQLYALITERLLTIRPPSESLKLIIDDGIDIDHALYRERRDEMLRDYRFHYRSAYEQECLIANLARHNFTQRFIVSSDGSVERLPETFTGEADIKIPGYIKAGEQNLVVSQDTDIIFILLLHMKTMLPVSTAFANPNFGVWLDSQTPSDRNKGLSRPYRFLNIKALYYEIMGLFAREYPAITNPIETFIFLTYCLETDFTVAFNTHLSVTPRLVWNTFSALHTTQEIISERGYLLFNENMIDPLTVDAVIAKSKRKTITRESELAKMGQKRCAERHYSYPLEWRSLLGEAVTCTFDTQKIAYNIELNDVKCSQFLYLLCQIHVINDLASLGHSQFDKKARYGIGGKQQRAYITNVDELFMWISSIEDQVARYKTSNTESDHNKRKLIEITSNIERKNKMPKLLSQKKQQQVPKKKTFNLGQLDSHFTTPKTVRLDFGELVKEIGITDEIEEDEEDDDNVEEEEDSLPQPLVIRQQTSISINKKLADLCKKEIPKQYGVPSLQAMLARIARTTWVMNYHQNGCRNKSYITNFAETHPNDATLSRYGWKAEEIPQCEATIRAGAWNNSYYTSVFESSADIEFGTIPFRVYRMVETDQIYNKSHDVYYG